MQLVVVIVNYNSTSLLQRCLSALRRQTRVPDKIVVVDVGAGVVDADYTGELKVIMFNHGKEDFTIKAGDRCAQLIFERISNPQLVAGSVSQPTNNTARGSGGFGSTGLRDGVAFIGDAGAAQVPADSVAALEHRAGSPDGAAAVRVRRADAAPSPPLPALRHTRMQRRP